MSATNYRCVGSVRGWCGHKHRTLSGALRCLQDDSDGCGRQGGYSDREVLVYEGDERQDKTVLIHNGDYGPVGEVVDTDRLY